MACFPTGIPRPSSSTDKEPSALMVTAILLPKPDKASSTALSTISQTKWCKPVPSVDPIYIPGRFLTASNPSRT